MRRMSRGTRLPATDAPTTISTPSALVTAQHAEGTPDPWQIDAMLAQESLPNDHYSSPMKDT
jgi:hypothetical protein